MVNQGAAKDACPRCVKGKMVTDNESGEMFCSKCGFVMSEKLQESGPEWRSFTQDEHGDRARAGAPTSLTCLLYTSPSPRDGLLSRMPSSA